ncbi:uncharacterized protein PITG_10569 [Phytophthora infestans T30-4]|uniref:Uncharacterized protein n=2 Tax=Phytophthora infestans TaxID=4787 RepID=D0NFM5_PHYIT|nr:uncharacterized protein PITG_10569 [Phytophthora infestans T30-4]EEY57014.1 hypothetical protein PITG_10569 [Phytophthora infestans T30-4]KAF4132228.1 hypothetical protein GN958_ATG18580 [Phytophthora infestans]KAF4132597.1 hypothetical protein GN958_ATG18212 [Phytophthora infestans]|eukprot:XP_002902342.1 hypothetical protein PITG_10569 [Phytophthora infestans T30-4]
MASILGVSRHHKCPHRTSNLGKAERRGACVFSVMSKSPRGLDEAHRVAFWLSSEGQASSTNMAPAAATPQSLGCDVRASCCF